MKVSVIVALLSMLVSCSDSGGLADRIQKTGEIVVLTTNQPTTYYIDREGEPTGPEHDMVQAFAEHMGVKARFEVLDSVEAVIASLQSGEGDIAAAGLTVTEERKQQFDFGPALMSVSEYLVCHRDIGAIKGPDQLNDLQIVIPASSSYIDTLKQQYPEVKWQIDENLITERLLEKVRLKEIQCTISDSTIFDISRRYYPEIINSYELISGSQLAWMYNMKNASFTSTLNDWFDSYKDSGEYDQNREKYYGYIDTFDYVDIQVFKRRIKQRLPKYKSLFIQAAKKYGISPSLLAAQSYQESHWNPKAKSPTGVRGIMMLTLPVAKSLGVTSRLDAEQNIFAGAKYLNKMKKMFDGRIGEPDMSWLALAAYNVGRGHFRDAQRLAESLGKDPNLWLDMKEVLPLLSEKKYYKDLKYGYARGNEPVQYVKRIRDYDNILVQDFK